MCASQSSDNRPAGIPDFCHRCAVEKSQKVSNFLPAVKLTISMLFLFDMPTVLAGLSPGPLDAVLKNIAGTATTLRIISQETGQQP